MLIVMKFGGTSVKHYTADVVKTIIDHYADGTNRLAVVVSAPKDDQNSTSVLRELANERIPDDHPERDALIDYLIGMGEDYSTRMIRNYVNQEYRKMRLLRDLRVFDDDVAEALNIREVGLISTAAHGRARLIEMSEEGKRNMRNLFAKNKIVIVPGFQGITEKNLRTTLGPGASDLTGVVLASELDADKCMIFTDVSGVYTTRPQGFEEEDRKPVHLDAISYDELLELGLSGAAVMEPRSVRVAKKTGTVIEIKSSYEPDGRGTYVLPRAETLAAYSASGKHMNPVIGVAVGEQDRYYLDNIPHRPGEAAAIFRHLHERNIVVDMIVQNVWRDEETAEVTRAISFTAKPMYHKLILSALAELAERRGLLPVREAGFAKLSIVGIGMEKRFGIAARFFSVLGESGINVYMVSSSDIKVSILVDRVDADVAARCVCEEFGLTTADEEDNWGVLDPEKTRSVVGDFVARRTSKPSSRIERAEVHGVYPLANEILVELFDVYNKPNMLGQIFRELAENQCNIDLILQNISSMTDRETNVSFTVEADCRDALVAVLERLKGRFYRDFLLDPKSSLLAVAGLGVSSHTEIVVRAMELLSQAGANLETICTSESRMSFAVTTGGKPLPIETLKSLEAEFRSE